MGNMWTILDMNTESFFVDAGDLYVRGTDGMLFRAVDAFCYDGTHFHISSETKFEPVEYSEDIITGDITSLLLS